ncbi:DUF1002 domain-containing protein [Lacticaseibacillus thailandensis]|nr:DUF1002 domain-containing protein [Lacticaseibacillus thailandensis]
MKKLFWALAAVVVAVIGLGTQHVAAATDSAWDKPVVTLGSSLTSSQRQGVIDTLTDAAGTGDSYNTLTVDGATLVKYLNPSGDNFTTSSGVWSSALVQKTSSGGINVKIVNYNGANNITTITADQYRNAAVTAGVTNANIYITSPVSIDGSGALAGVYAAFAANGSTLSQSQVTAAQDEVNTLSSITQANKNKDGYSDKQLNNAIAGIKKQMATDSNNGQQTLSSNQIGNIVDSQLKNNNLGTIINNNQRTQIINLMVKIQNSGALKGSGFKQQASDLANSIQSSAKGLFNKIKGSVGNHDSSWWSSLWQRIVNFFTSIYNWVLSLF